MKVISHYWETKQRYYRTVLYQDLLNDWIVFTEWGSRFNAIRQSRKELVDNRTEGLKIVARINRVRLKRGYTMVLDKT